MKPPKEIDAEIRSIARLALWYAQRKWLQKEPQTKWRDKDIANIDKLIKAEEKGQAEYRKFKGGKRYEM